MKFLFFICALLCATGSFAQLIYETVSVEYDSAMEFKALQLIPIRPKDRGGRPFGEMISLSKAMQQGLAVVSERGTASTENVHWLRVNNKSGKDIFVGSGETFSGGRQDRMVSRDTILGAIVSDQYIPVMCIEEGRWSGKEKKILYNNYANLALRKVVDRTPNQALVWKEILAQLDSGGFHSPTLTYNTIKQNHAVELQHQQYIKFFLDKFKNSDSSITGFVCVSGYRVIGCDIFRDREMFYDQLEPLLAGYINEAVTRGQAPMLTDEEIKAYMDKLLTNETKQDEFCRDHGKIFRSAGRVIHVTSYSL